MSAIVRKWRGFDETKGRMTGVVAVNRRVRTKSLIIGRRIGVIDFGDAG